MSGSQSVLVPFGTPGGNPSAIRAVAGTYAEAADGFSAHQSQINSTAGGLVAAWTGQSQGAFTSLSSTIAAHFASAAGAAHEVSEILSAYATRLAGLQAESRQATQEYLHAVADQQAELTRLAQARQAAHQAWQNEASDRSAEQTGGATASQVSADAGALSVARFSLGIEKGYAANAADRVQYWATRGQDIYNESTTVALQVASALSAITVPVPPVAKPAHLVAPHVTGMTGALAFELMVASVLGTAVDHAVTEEITLDQEIATAEADGQTGLAKQLQGDSDNVLRGTHEVEVGLAAVALGMAAGAATKAGRTMIGEGDRDIAIGDGAINADGTVSAAGISEIDISTGEADSLLGAPAAVTAAADNTGAEVATGPNSAVFAIDGSSLSLPIPSTPAPAPSKTPAPEGEGVIVIG